MSKTAVKLMQKALDRHLMDGRWRHDVTEAIALVNATKAERDELLEALRKLIRGKLVGGTIGEYHIAVSTKDHDDTRDLIARIQARGVDVKS